MRNYQSTDLDYDEPPARPARRYMLHRCACGPDLPGTCPGPVNCPYSGLDDDVPQLAGAAEE